MNLFDKILGNEVIDETNQPEDEDVDEKKQRIDHPHKGLTEIYLPIPLILAPSLGLGDRSRSHSVYVGLHYDVHEGFEETEDQPAVDHLDVGGVWEIIAHTKNEYCQITRFDIKIFSLEKELLEPT